MRVLDDIAIERERRLRGLHQPDHYAHELWRKALISQPTDLERERLSVVFQFAKKIKYHHLGLTSDIYFSHPLRVAAIGVLMETHHDSRVGILGILHNTLEVSHVSVDTLAKLAGTNISEQVAALTVDRNVQWDRAYKTTYYKNLMAGPRFTRVVKIIDKLDNLFLLGLNEDEDVRAKYLSEIEDFVLPMVAETLPELLAYMINLVCNCRTVGFIETPLVNNIASLNSKCNTD